MLTNDQKLDIKQLKLIGFTNNTIGNKYGISHERVRQILKKFNITGISMMSKVMHCKRCGKGYTVKYQEGSKKVFNIYCSEKCKNYKKHFSEDEKREFNRLRNKKYRNTESGKKVVSELQKKSNKKFVHKTRARTFLNQSIRIGKVIKPINCSICNKTNCRIEGHHEDYSKPLEVIWCCTVCHYQLDKKLREALA